MWRQRDKDNKKEAERQTQCKRKAEIWTQRLGDKVTKRARRRDRDGDREMQKER